MEDYYTPWKKVFAWRPAKLEDGSKVWLKYVERRYCIFGCIAGMFVNEYNRSCE